MIARLLIANRGEIAVRIVHACRELGIETVAVFSDADARAVHVMAADRAVRIGRAAATDSYLSIAAIIRAATDTGVDAVHPGYGFLSENAAFARACEDAGLIFVGPPSAVLARMGSKIEARRTMQAAGVPIVPGVTPDDQSDEGLLRAVRAIGGAALIKASSGGGGKGMRAVAPGDDVRATIQAARREAQQAFGTDLLYVERRIEQPFHVEVQIMADAHGHAVHVFERECSVQRRHQKVIEESPSPHLTPALRGRMTSTAVKAAVASGYRNAGTCEFLVDLSDKSIDDAPFYFLEMNSRLQVEHGVTELVAGVDLVQAQLRVASGEPLPWTQNALSQRGHAIEARVYAEDPAQGFLPQAGRLLLYREPHLPGVRIDSGFREGQSVTVNYDPLIAKVIAFAATRDEAITKLREALRAFPVLGITTNIPFLLCLVAHPRFRDASIDTAFLDRHASELATSSPTDLQTFVDAAYQAAAQSAPPGGQRNTADADGMRDPWATPNRWRMT